MWGQSVDKVPVAYRNTITNFTFHCRIWVNQTVTVEFFIATTTSSTVHQQSSMPASSSVLSPPPASSWFFFNEDDLLAPLKVDISYKGARYVDSFCWNCNPESNTMSPYEFSCRTCADVGLPDGFQWKMALQIQEQVDAYRILIHMLKTNGAELMSRMNSLMPIALGIRFQTVDYSDRFLFDCCGSGGSMPYAPEYFARVTVLNLGLPGEMEPIIARSIRESIFRQLFSFMETIGLQTEIEDTAAAGGGRGEGAKETEMNTGTGTGTAEDTAPAPAPAPAPALVPSELSVTVVAPNQAVDMLTHLWRRARPQHFEDQQSIPQCQLPRLTDTNAHAWCSNMSTYHAQHLDMPADQQQQRQTVR